MDARRGHERQPKGRTLRYAEKGGHARAARLTPEERSASAKVAELARWGRLNPEKLPRETHGGDLQLPVGDGTNTIVLSCAVLDGKHRVISTRRLGRAFGARKTGTDEIGGDAPKLPPFLSAQNLFPFISDKLRMRLISPSIYKQKTGSIAYGYDAELLPEICGVVLDAAKAGVLKRSQTYLVDQAEVMIRGFATVGIIALVDEATGFQSERAKDELQRILQAYVVEEMRPWLKAFPTDFFRQIYRLYGWKFEEGNAKRPGVVGKFINEWIYERLPDPVLPDLRQRNPVVDGRRRHKHHQFLTEETGIPHLDKQILAVTTLMRAAGTKELFTQLLVNAFPKQGEQLLMPVFHGGPTTLPPPLA
jgi:hypothetical protein